MVEALLQRAEAFILCVQAFVSEWSAGETFINTVFLSRTSIHRRHADSVCLMVGWQLVQAVTYSQTQSQCPTMHLGQAQHVVIVLLWLQVLYILQTVIDVISFP